jgi:acetylornithine/N-succinyldiaminopimelate aminotransferase
LGAALRADGIQKGLFLEFGAEAGECAVKVARKYAADKKGSDYFNISR